MLETYSATLDGRIAIRARLLVYPAIVLLYALAIYSLHAKHGTWGMDSYNYSVRMLIYDGAPFAQARDRARAFFKPLPFTQTPRNQALLALPKPHFWSLFAPRMLYPWLASRLYPRYGFEALHIVTGAAFVAALFGLYFLLLEFAPAWIAMLLVFAFGAFPAIHDASEAALTDMLAVTFVIPATLALCRFLRNGNGWWLAAFGVATGLLTFSRPIPYVLLIGAAVPLVAAWVRRDRVVLTRAAALVAVAAVWCIVIAIVAGREHAPGFAQMIKYSQVLDNVPATISGKSFLLHETPQLALVFIYSLLGMVIPISGVYMMVVRRADPRALALLGVAASAIVSTAFDLVPDAIIRTALLPILPAIFAGTAMAFARISGSESRDAPA